MKDETTDDLSDIDYVTFGDTNGWPASQDDLEIEINVRRDTALLVSSYSNCLDSKPPTTYTPNVMNKLMQAQNSSFYFWFTSPQLAVCSVCSQ